MNLSSSSSATGIPLNADELAHYHEVQGLACRGLWAAVLRRAMLEASRATSQAELQFNLDEACEWAGMTKKEYLALKRDEKIALRTGFLSWLKQDAREWISSDSERIGGFVWVCVQLDMDHHVVRRKVAES